MRRLIAALVAALLAVVMLFATASANTTIDNLTNAYRAQNGRPALVTWEPLQELVNLRANQIVSNFAHPSDWQYLFDRLPSCVTALGENIASRYDGNAADDPSQLVQMWIDSPTHRANLLGGWTWQASATVVVNGKTYGAQLFASGCTSTTQPPKPAAPTAKPAPRVTQPSAAPSLANTSVAQ